MTGLQATDQFAEYDDRILNWDAPTAQPGDPANPYPEWKRLREESPVLFRFVDGMEAPFVYLFRHRDVDAALRNTADLSNSIEGEALAIGDRTLIGLDPPEHRRYRQVVTPPLTRRMVERWDEVLIKKTIHEILDEVQPRGRAEFVADIARAYPTQVVSRIVGLPREDWPLLTRWAPILLAAPLDREPALRAADEVRSYLKAFHSGERSVPDDSIFRAVKQSQSEGAPLTDEDVDSFVMQIIQAGIDTTYRGLSNAVSLLIDRPEVLDRIRQDRSLVESAIEESLRFEPPNTAVVRLAVRDTELGGHKIPKGAIVCANLASANRDPEFCDHPDEFDIDRADLRRHITFGMGIHQCIGLHLARLELRAGLDAILDRLPNIRRDVEETAHLSAHIHGVQFRSPTALPVLWDVS